MLGVDQGRRLVVAVLTVTALALLGLASPAGAAVGGQFKQLALPDGCLDDGGAGGCKNIVAPMTNVGEPAMSANGRFLYVPARDSDTLNTFERDPATGVLTERSCIRYPAALGTCTGSNAPPLEDATAAALSPDGKSLYVVGGAAGGSAPDGIIHFTIGNDGLPTFESCFTATASSCGGVAPAFGNPASVAVSPDGASVYVANYNSHAINVFARNTTTGALNQATLTTAQKCLKRTADADACTVLNLIEQPRDIEVTPDGKQVVVVSSGDSGAGCMTTAGCYNLFVLDRAPTTGALTLHPGTSACVSYENSTKPMCKVHPLFYGATQIAVTPDGRHIYASMRGCCGVRGLDVVDRDPATGDLSARTTWCVKYPGTSQVCPVTSPIPNDPFDVALAPDGSAIYTTGYNGQRLGIYDRSSDGTATPKPGPLGCLATPATAADGCSGVLNQGTNMEYVVPSPDGRHVYGFGLGKILSFAVDRAPVCTSLPVETPFNTAVTITLPCSDADGDSLTYEILSQPARGQLGALQGNKIAYGPLVGSSGPDSFTFRATGAGVQAECRR
jgi:DNA-binding beta-propeller fold protein YncE